MLWNTRSYFADPLIVDGLTVGGNVDRTRRFPQAQEILRCVREFDVIGIQVRRSEIGFFYNDEFFTFRLPLLNARSNYHAIVDLYGPVYGVEIKDYQELYPRHHVFQEQPQPRQHHPLFDEINRYPPETRLALIGYWFQDELRFFENPRHGKKLSEKIYRNGLIYVSLSILL